MGPMNSLEIRGLDASGVWDHENAFYWFSHPSRIGKLMAHLDLYRKIARLPGHVVECGVYKAVSLIRFATFRQMLETDASREVVGFDAFGAFPRHPNFAEDERMFIKEFEESGGDGLSVDEVREICRLKGFENIELVAGDVLTSVPEYMERRPEFRIALLHLDLDVEKPTAACLEACYDRIVPGGLIVVDDYNAVAGATRAADAFCRAHGLSLRKPPYYTVPAWIEKPAQ